MSDLRWKIAQAAEIRWWQQYLSLKDPKEYLSWKKSYWCEFLQQCDLPPLPDHATCLDAGCSVAGIFTILDKQRVVAIDPLLNEYQTHCANHFQTAWYPHTEFRQQILEHLEDNHCYDVVFCLNVINHVNNLKDSIYRLWRAVREGGTMVVSVDAHNYKLFKYLFRIAHGDILHPHQYDLDDYKTMFTQICETPIVSCKLIKKEFFFNYYVLVLKKKAA